MIALSIRALKRGSSRGMTLIELLVVVSIIMLLAVVVLPNIAGTTESRRFREAARSTSSFIARGQSRAFDAREPKGVMFQSLAAEPDACIDLFFADTPDAYAGELTSSRAIITPISGTPTARPVTFDAMTTQRFLEDPAFCRPGDSIQFGGLGPYFRLVPPVTPGPGSVEMWTVSRSQVPGNTAWPRATTADGLPYRIRRQPRKSSTGVLQLQQGAAIDLAWSCLGSQPLRAPGYPALVPDLTQPVILLFDSSGKPTEMVHSGGIRTTVGEPLFLLVGSSEIAGNPFSPAAAGQAGDSAGDRVGANWQYADSVWLCIDNNSGVVKFGNVAPNAPNVLASQYFVRMTIALGAAER